MASIGPYTQAYDMKQMYDFPDLRSTEEQKNTYPEKSIMGILSCNPDFSIFAHIVEIARFNKKLAEEQADFTIFVPSDHHLKQKYPKEFFENMDTILARQIVTFSIMNRKLVKNVLQSSPMSIFPTLDRSNSMEISTINNVTMLPNCVKVIHWNHLASNGLIHVVDNLVMPYLYL